MKDLIEALQIMVKYANPRNPTHCEHDIMMFSDEFDYYKFSGEDIKRLDELGIFLVKDEDDGEYGNGFFSYRYGSC